METPTRPGWYDDPESPQQLRYYDGVIWTKHTTPRGVPQEPAQQAPEAQPAQSAQSAPRPPGTDAQPVGPVQPQQPAYPGQPPVAPPGQQPYGQQQPPSPPGWPAQYPPQGGWHAPPMGTPYRSVPSTPDGQPLAGWWKRAVARIVDWVIVWVGALPLTGYFLYRAGQTLSPALESWMRELESGTASPTGPALDPAVLRWMILYSVVLTLVAMAYEVFFTTRSGSTPGKKLLGLRVRLRDQDGPLPFQAALLRTILPMGGNMVSAVPLLSALIGLAQVADIFFPLLNVRKQALHDLMAKTNVVDTRR